MDTFPAKKIFMWKIVKALDTHVILVAWMSQEFTFKMESFSWFQLSKRLVTNSAW